MVDQAMDLWVSTEAGFTPVSSDNVKYYMDPDLAALASGFPAGGGLTFYGNAGMPDNWYTEANYPIGTTPYPLGGTTSVAPTSSIGAFTAMMPTSAAAPTGLISWTKISWVQVAAVLAVIAVIYMLWKKRQSKGVAAAPGPATTQ